MVKFGSVLWRYKLILIWRSCCGWYCFQLSHPLQFLLDWCPVCGDRDIAVCIDKELLQRAREQSNSSFFFFFFSSGSELVHFLSSLGFGFFFHIKSSLNLFYWFILWSSHFLLFYHSEEQWEEEAQGSMEAMFLSGFPPHRSILSYSLTLVPLLIRRETISSVGGQSSHWFSSIFIIHAPFGVSWNLGSFHSRWFSIRVGRNRSVLDRKSRAVWSCTSKKSLLKLLINPWRFHWGAEWECS